MNSLITTYSAFACDEAASAAVCHPDPSQERSGTAGTTIDALSRLLEWGGSFFRSQEVLCVGPVYGGIPPPHGFHTPRRPAG
jgi:hypothetical protein